ncbi:LacI family DNA-binding transcriptional regulator [Spongiimicrobium salis]|uniref:LacI family DNA-binding transcriptional regulator n=1 Tax=Spongiimicrobium salis TaxID=1667022 RepID=UPI00374CB9AE
MENDSIRSNITLKEIAYLLNLSISTVSKALNDSREISTRTKEKVKEMAREYNYRPNSIARNFKSSKSYTIGIVVSELSTPFFRDAMAGIMEESIKNDYKIMTYPSGGSNKKEEYLIRMLMDGSIDGLLLEITEETVREEQYQYLEELQSTGFPVVLMDNTSRSMNYNQVFVDYENCGFMAAQKLTENICRNIVLLIDKSPVGKQWAMGFEEAISQHKLKIQDNPVVVMEMDDNMEKKIEVLLSQFPDLDGIIVQNEQWMTLVEAIVAKSPQKDIQMVNYIKNTKALPKQTKPNICYMTSDYFKLGEEAMKLVLKKIRKNEIEVTRKTMEAYFVNNSFQKDATEYFSRNFNGVPHLKNGDEIPYMETL